jgi:hypothetical protein
VRPFGFVMQINPEQGQGRQGRAGQGRAGQGRAGQRVRNHGSCVACVSGRVSKLSGRMRMAGNCCSIRGSSLSQSQVSGWIGGVKPFEFSMPSVASSLDCSQVILIGQE